ncbi:hypothetical protein N7504_004199 [Penicillium tannophilum]|nr:hypothetical protein N7504_004199 [Penicillium tannophilum]
MKIDIHTNRSQPPTITMQNSTQRVITDWEAWNREPLEDQSVDLPAPKDVNLSKLKFDWVLSEPDYFEEWIETVAQVLDSVGLKALISQTIPRPTYLNDASKRWSILSKQLTIWMARRVDPDFVEIITRHEEVIYADSFVRKARDSLCFWDM